MSEPIAVLVATRDRPEPLRRCLSALLANEYPAFRIWVIDQSATEESGRVVSSLGDPRLEYVRHEARGLARARNLAVATAGDYASLLAFTDDDCVPAPDWLQQTARAASCDPEAGVIFGVFEAGEHDPSTHYVPLHVPSVARRTTRPRRVSASGGNMAVRRCAFDLVGGFDPCLGAGAPFESGEDEDFARRAARAGIAVAYAPESRVVHEGARAYADGSAQALLRGHALAFGAIYAKELRLGHARSLLDAASRAGRLAGRAVLPGMPVSRASMLARLPAFATGYARALRHPLDRRRGVFIDKPSD